jgi:hypothetical protein
VAEAQCDARAGPVINATAESGLPHDNLNDYGLVPPAPLRITNG